MHKEEQKTIFISLSSQAVFRNLFFFPGSFFDRMHQFLEQEKEWRVIILIPDRMVEKYLPLMKGKLSDRLCIESVCPLPDKNKIQQIFVFFHTKYFFKSDINAWIDSF